MTTPRVLEGKLAVVTGASKLNGIGFAIASLFAQNGADIVLHYNSNEKRVLDCLAKIREIGVKVVAVQANASSLNFGEELVKGTLLAFPDRKIDILVNNAADARFSDSFEKEPLEDFDHIFHINVRGPLSLVQAALLHMTSPGGRIINIGSIAGLVCMKGASIYSASKGALNTMTIGWARELGPKGITVNVVAPGPIATDWYAPEEHPITKFHRSHQHVKRDGTSEEVASMVLYVASPGSSFVSGQILAIDGGYW